MTNSELEEEIEKEQELCDLLDIPFTFRLLDLQNLFEERKEKA